MNLHRERLHILRALAPEAETALLHDLTLPGAVRRLLSELESGSDAQRARRVRQLDALYDEHGPPLIRCLLEYAYLLHTTSEAEDYFGGVLTRLEADLRKHPWLGGAVVNELNRYAHSPYDGTQRLSELILKRSANAPGVLARVIENREADFALRYAAAELVVARKDAALYPALLGFLIEASQAGSSKEAFLTGWRRLARLYADTGAAGLALAVAAFKENRLRNHAPFILGEFGEKFHRWLTENPVAPSRNWARVLLQCWPRAGSLRARDQQLLLLIDDWASRPGLADFIRGELERRLRDKPNYLSPASREVQARVQEFVGAGSSAAPGPERFAAAADGPAEDWDAFTARRPAERSEGWAAAEAVARATPAGRERLLRWLDRNGHKARFLSGAFERLLEPGAFAALPPESQRGLLALEALAEAATTAQLERLLAGATDAAVRAQLQQAANRVRGRQLGRSRGEGGDLA